MILKRFRGSELVPLSRSKFSLEKRENEIDMEATDAKQRMNGLVNEKDEMNLSRADAEMKQHLDEKDYEWKVDMIFISCRLNWLVWATAYLCSGGRDTLFIWLDIDFNERNIMDQICRYFKTFWFRILVYSLWPMLDSIGHSLTSVYKTKTMRRTDSNILDVKAKKPKGMGRGRTPCCDAHVNRGPWSPAEDIRLISFIQKYGHDNWRALPKQAGLLRCGKSCRLRWVNYLRPDLKRGNFTKEEEEAVFQLHQSLGNKWSKIAAHLPGRTDNEIKNVWNTHLKKKLSQTANREGTNMESSVITSSSSYSSTVESNLNHQKIEIDSQINTQPHFSTMKTGQMDSNGINQLEDFTWWQDLNLLDSLLNVDEDTNWGLPTPDIQLGSAYNDASIEFNTEPDFDLWGMLNHDDKEKDELPVVDTFMIRKNTDTGNEYITDQHFDSILESLENVSELSQISSGMNKNPGQYLVDVPDTRSAETANANGDKEMVNLDYFFPIWPSSPI